MKEKKEKDAQILFGFLAANLVAILEQSRLSRIYGCRGLKSPQIQFLIGFLLFYSSGSQGVYECI
jgi:hypothetical protein